MIFTPEQFAEHNKKLLAEKEDVSDKKESKGIERGIEKFMEFLGDMKNDIEEMETDLERKSNIDHSHEEFNAITEKFIKINDNISSEIKNVKSSIKHYDDKPVLKRINTIQEEVIQAPYGISIHL